MFCQIRHGNKLLNRFIGNRRTIIHLNVTRKHVNLRGGAGRKTVLLIFNPLISLYIYYDQYEKIWRNEQNNFFPRFVSMEMAAIFDVRALTEVHRTLKPLLQME